MTSRTTLALGKSRTESWVLVCQGCNIGWKMAQMQSAQKGNDIKPCWRTEGQESRGTRSHHHLQHRFHFYFKTKTVLGKLTTEAKMYKIGSCFCWFPQKRETDLGEWKSVHLNVIIWDCLEHLAGDNLQTFPLPETIMQPCWTS